MLAAPKDSLIVGGGSVAIILADAVPPVPPSLEVTLPVVLFCCPNAVPVTLTENVHEFPSPNEASDRVMTLVPEVAAIVALPIPPVSPVSPFGVDITSPAGRVSLKPTPVRLAFVFGLPMVKVSEVDPLSGMLAAPNDLLIVGGKGVTVMLAEAVPPVPPSLEVTLPVVLFCCPTAVPVTLTEKVPELPAASVASVKVMTPVPWVAVIVLRLCCR